MLRRSPTTDKRSRCAETTKSILSVFRFIAIGLSIGLLGSFAFGRWLLLKFPSIFTFGLFRKKGLTEEEVASAIFKMWFVGYGFRV
ncbi:hypothetical protein Hanom_Chr16g01476811 [Helianthus anomalus]